MPPSPRRRFIIGSFSLKTARTHIYFREPPPPPLTLNFWLGQVRRTLKISLARADLLGFRCLRCMYVVTHVHVLTTVYNVLVTEHYMLWLKLTNDLSLAFFTVNCCSQIRIGLQDLLQKIIFYRVRQIFRKNKCCFKIQGQDYCLFPGRLIIMFTVQL